jgi:SagB-type dehydrogenase family enzyme
MARRNRAAAEAKNADRRRPVRPHPSGQAWGTWHPIASTFHAGTKDIPWADAERADAIAAAQEAHARIEPPPSPFKKVRGRGKRLPSARPQRDFAEVLLDRRTWRGFGKTSIPLSKLGTLLGLTFGVQMEGRTTAGAHVVFKTSPSGGARHPIEAYVLALGVEGLAKGLYYFAPQTRLLHAIRLGASREQLVEYLSGQWWFGGAGALIFMTAVLPRVRWRYPHPRAYRSVLLGAGHLCQTFCLVATALKLAPFCTQALTDSRIERDLGIDGENEVLIYAAGVGSRPRDGKWVQWPAHQPEHPYLPPVRPKKK